MPEAFFIWQSPFAFFLHIENWSLNVRHDAEPTTDAVVEMTLDYHVENAETLVGMSPEERRLEIRERFLTGSDGQFGDANGTDQRVVSQWSIEGEHHLDRDTGEASGQLHVITGMNVLQPEHVEEMLVANRELFAGAIAADIESGLAMNITQTERVNADRGNDQHSV